MPRRQPAPNPGVRPHAVPPKPDPTPGPGLAGSPSYSGILILAGLVIVCAGLRTTASIVAPIFLVITLVITVDPLRTFLVRRRAPSWLASVISMLAIYGLLAVILGSVVWSVLRLVAKLPDYASAFTKLFNYLAKLAESLGYGAEQIRSLASQFQVSSLAGPARSLLSAITG